MANSNQVGGDFWRQPATFLKPCLYIVIQYNSCSFRNNGDFHTYYMQIIGEIKTGNPRFHSLIEFYFQSFDQNILSFENIYSKPCEKIWLEVGIFRYFSFTFYIQFILLAWK